MRELKITLRAARVNAGLSRKEAAKYFSISPETISNYELNSSKVPRSFFTKVEAVYNIPLDYIFFGKEEDFINEQKKLSVG